MNLDEIVRLARQQIALQDLITDLESALAAHKEDLRELAEEALPAAMAEAGLKTFKLDTGEEINIKNDFVVGIPVELRERAYDWLTERGYGGLIKTEVRALFGKGELANAEKLLADLAKRKYVCELTRNVPWQTLKAFVTEQTKAGKPVPVDMFGVIPTNKAIVKVPKEG